MIPNCYYLSCQTQYNNFVYVTGKHALITNSTWFNNIRDCPYSTSFIKPTDTSVFFNLELNCDSSEQFENVLCS